MITLLIVHKVVPLTYIKKNENICKFVIFSFLKYEILTISEIFGKETFHCTQNFVSLKKHATFQPKFTFVKYDIVATVLEVYTSNPVLQR